MQRTRRERRLLLLALLAGSLPFAFALIRAITTGTDVRYLWMAVAACPSAMAAIALPGGGGTVSGALAVRFVAATFISSAAAAGTGIMLGATSGVGIAIVALAFGLCSAAGWTLARLSRPPS